MANRAEAGKTALDAKDYPLAIEHFTAALAESQSPVYLILRSTAYQRANQHELALADAENAVIAASNRARKEQIATAHFRRAVALYGLGRYGDARLCLTWCMKKNEKEKGLTLWQNVVKAAYDKAGGEEAEANKCVVKEIPDKAEAPTEKLAGDLKKEPSVIVQANEVAQKIRHEWYQSASTVTFTVFAKGVPKDKAEITIEEGSISVSFPIGTSGTTWDFTVDPLFSIINPSESTFSVTTHKIELILRKVPPPTDSAIPPNILQPIANRKTEGKPPAYPTSSKSGPKDWDSVAEKEEIEEGQDDVEGFFKTLYKDASPDVRKAMIKSYQESNGTALSTNWSDVSKGPVETKPPEGMVAKKYGE
ncbi:hypothetical protein B7494_g4468 [Chlorociboria aeruginascens]|nr:hypothetical protein B7494_g4468 [Chlorociboria aeruginascens]